MDSNISTPLAPSVLFSTVTLSPLLSAPKSLLYGLALLAVVSIIATTIRQRLPDVEIYPIINKTAEEYLKAGKALLAKGAKQYGGKPFRVYTGMGTVTVLAPEFCQDVKNDDRLSSTEFLLAYWQAGTPGFEPYFSSGSELLREMIRTYLGQSDVAKLSQPLADEAADAVRDIFSDNEEWHEITLASLIPQIVARVSALVFLGPELCRNPDWLNITVNYPSKAMAAARVLRSYPPLIRRYLHWFLPCCRELRHMLRKARITIEPIQQMRREQDAKNDGVLFNNALAWIEKLTQKQQDRSAQNAAFQQLGLSILANASSTDIVSQNILDLCQNPELIDPLRDEILRETQNGWATSTLYNLKLMDSEIYPNPECFDGRRFLRMREAGNNEHVAQLASVSPEHLGFGLGSHACPGRFFGASSTKLIMSSILLNYEFKLPHDKADIEPMRFGFSTLANPKAKILIRRRKDVV
ncbi:hypothetical protein N0V82_005146 [Gnomoniopsis sp. IMI 355080]|nr:hypothetical protein N0V82_005146 [Gnomoniopsis sp. IMI 355080]